MKKVSIIVPVYNAEATIDRCVKSLINQTYQDIEIILINDGSKDKTFNLLKKFEKLYSEKIKIFNQDNCGAGQTRNRGIKIATGDYVLFVDADDALELDAVASLVEKIKDNDIIIFGHDIIGVDGKLLAVNIPKNNEWTELKYTCTCGKMYSLSFIRKNKISYPVIRIGEDSLFMLSAVTKTNKICVLEQSKYIVYKNNSSVTSNVNSNNQIYDVTEIIEYIKKNIDMAKYSDEVTNFFLLKTVVQSIIMQLDGIPTKELVNLYKKNIKEIWGDKNVKRKIKFHYQKGEECSINLIVNSFVIMTKLDLLTLFITLLKKMKFVRV